MPLPGRLLTTLTTLFTAALASSAVAAELPPKPSLADVIKASKPSDWRPLDPANTLYMQLPGGRVVIELAPTFAPRHVANIRTLVKEHYFDGLAVIRSQDNWVSQWGDADEKNPKSLGTAAATLPGEFTIDMRNDRQFTASRTATATPRSSATPTACPPPATRKPAAPGWPTATAWWASAATTAPTAAVAARSTW